jgi:hypothetical protein
VEQPLQVDPKLRPDSASVSRPNGSVIAGAALVTEMPAGRPGQHLLGHGLMFAAAAGAGGDPLCSGIRDWIAAPVIGPGLFLPACRRLRAGGRIGPLRTAGDSFRACGFARQ